MVVADVDQFVHAGLNIAVRKLSCWRMDDVIPPLADAIYREKVLRARSIPATKKMGWGAELFAESCSRMRSGIRSQFPDLSTAEVEKILRERLNRLSRFHEHGVFVPVEKA